MNLNPNPNPNPTYTHAGDQYEHWAISVLRRLACEILPCVEEYITATSKARNKKAATRRTDEAKHAKNLALYNKRASNSMRKHVSALQRRF